MEIKKIESAKTDCLLSLADGVLLYTNNYNASWCFSWKHLQDPKSFLASFFSCYIKVFPPLLLVIAFIEEKRAWEKRDRQLWPQMEQNNKIQKKINKNKVIIE